MASKPPHIGPLQEAFRFRPFPHWDPVPDWVLAQLDPRVIRQVAAIAVRFEKTVLEQQAKAAAEVERLIGQG